MYNLDKAREHIHLSKLSEAYREIEQVIVSVISERYEISRGDTFDKIYAGLVRKYVSEDLAKQTVSLLQDCQVAQFSPLIGDEKALMDYERAQNILKGFRLLQLNPEGFRSDRLGSDRWLFFNESCSKYRYKIQSVRRDGQTGIFERRSDRK